MNVMKASSSLFLLFIALLPLHAQQTEKIYLSGRDAAHPVEWEFRVDGGRRAGVMSRIPVPSCWELQGFGTYNYGKDDHKASETGYYRTRFFVPPRWQGRRIRIVFGGVMTDTEVRINGHAAGPVHQGGFYQFSYDITPWVHAGDSNLLEVTVHKTSANERVELAERRSDYWLFGGIYRPVWLEALPPEHITWTAVDARADGTFRMAVHLAGLQHKARVRAKIYDRNGRLAGTIPPQRATRRDTMVVLRGRLADIRPWSAEDPVLYHVDVVLERDGKVLHTVRERTGFRTFEVVPGEGLFLNGKRIVLKGCDRHSFRPSTGRALSREDCREDVRLIKAMNMNAVRMSHYPPDPWFLDYCDEMGLYVLDELAGWQRPPYDTPTGKKLVKEMLVRDVNHPSILFWDNGNEGGWNTALDGEFARYDLQRRPVLHPWTLHDSVDTDHYETYESVRNKLRSGNIFLPTEQLHGLYDGGAGAGLDDFWHLMWGHPLTGGMFIWVFADEGVVRTDRNCRIDVDGNHAPDGILGPHHEKEGSFFTIKEIWSPVYIETGDTMPHNFPLSIPLENRYDFTNLQECTFSWQLVSWPAPAQPVAAVHTWAEGTMAGPNIPPHKAGWLHPSLPEEALARADGFLLTARDPSGGELFTWSWPLRPSRKTITPLVKDTGSKPSLLPCDTALAVRSGSTTFFFDRRDGTLLVVKEGAQVIPFGGGPFVVPVRKATPRILPVTRTLVTDTAMQVVTEHHPFFRTLRWSILPGGWLRLDYAFPYEGETDYLGISFRYPESRMQGMTWRGKGPYRVWKNRLKGATYGVWQNDYNSFAPATRWDYPEFPGYYADVSWVVFDTDDGPITMLIPDDKRYLRVYRQPEGYKPRHAAMVWPEGDLSFLHTIPPIGTKFHDAAEMGPQGQKFRAHGMYRGTLYFHFGDPPSSQKNR